MQPQELKPHWRLLLERVLFHLYFSEKMCSLESATCEHIRTEEHRLYLGCTELNCVALCMPLSSTIMGLQASLVMSTYKSRPREKRSELEGSPQHFILRASVKDFWIAGHLLQSWSCRRQWVCRNLTKIKKEVHTNWVDDLVWTRSCMKNMMPLEKQGLKRALECLWFGSWQEYVNIWTL